VDTALPILAVTSRPDARMFKMLRKVRHDGLCDGRSEGLERLPVALRQVIQHRLYVSPSLVPHMQKRKSVTLDELTEMEQIVFSIASEAAREAAVPASA
jgi:DNA-binding NarL/FixJ family response regulator